jgi:hypothetical protein
VNIHSCLVVTTEGLVLGILDKMYLAKGLSQNHESKKTRALEEKESFRWVKSFETSTASIPEGVKVINVCDREGDMAD